LRCSAEPLVRRPTATGSTRRRPPCTLPVFLASAAAAAAARARVPRNMQRRVALREPPLAPHRARATDCSRCLSPRSLYPLSPPRCPRRCLPWCPARAARTPVRAVALRLVPSPRPSCPSRCLRMRQCGWRSTPPWWCLFSRDSPPRLSARVRAPPCCCPSRAAPCAARARMPHGVAAVFEAVVVHCQERASPHGARSAHAGSTIMAAAGVAAGRTNYEQPGSGLCPVQNIKDRPRRGPVIWRHIGHHCRQQSHGHVHVCVGAHVLQMGRRRSRQADLRVSDAYHLREPAERLCQPGKGHAARDQ